jgi:hypothetical protein
VWNAKSIAGIECFSQVIEVRGKDKINTIRFYPEFSYFMCHK